jgi:hypothetical protein
MITRLSQEKGRGGGFIESLQKMAMISMCYDVQYNATVASDNNIL